MKKLLLHCISLLLCFSLLFTNIVQADITSGYIDSAINSIRIIQQTYPVGSTFNNSDGVGGIQCKGFAGYVYYRMFGLSLPAYTSSANTLVHNSNISVVGEITSRPTVSQLKDMFGKGRTGDIIQGKKQSSQHTMVFMYTTSTGIHVYDCNSDGKNTVKERDLSYSEIAGTGYYTGYIYGISLYTAPNYTSKFVVGHNPTGVVDSIVAGYNSVTIRGWAFDQDDVNSQLAIHVYIGGEGHSVDINGNGIVANLERVDVNNVYGCGNYHGFSATVPTSKTGTQDVNVFAINVGGGANVPIGGSSVNIKNLDYKFDQDDPKENENFYNKDIYVQGWSISQEAIKAVQYSLDDRGWTDMERYDRDDVRKVHPAYPDGNEGFRTTINKFLVNQGKHTIAIRTVYTNGEVRNMGKRTINVAYDYIPHDIFEYNGNLYGMYYNYVNWNTAKSMCEKMGGHLVTINDKAENDEITKHLKGKRYWIGLNDVTTEGQYLWTDGNAATYKNFSTGEPNNTNDNEDYCEILSTGYWNDINVDGDTAFRNGFILEIEGEAIKPTSSKIFDNKRYEFYNNKMPQSIAEWYAEKKGGSLVNIDSAEKNSFIRTNATGIIWIGLNKVGDIFKWCNGDELSYTNWSDSEPNNITGIQDYARMYVDGTWDDCENTDGYNLVIEYPSAVIAKIEQPKASSVFEGDKEVTISGIVCSSEEIKNTYLRVNGTIYHPTRYDRADIMEKYPDAIDGNEGFTITLPRTAFNYDSNNISLYVETIDGITSMVDSTVFTFYKSYEPVNVGYYKGKIYAIYEDSLTWEQAKSFCETRGGNLAAITTKAEQNYVTSLLKNKAVSQYWLGATRGTGEEYSWVTGENFSYSNWDSGEPNNNNGLENCLIMLNSGKWNDQATNNPYPCGFIYEFDANALEVSQYSTFGESEYYLYNKSVPYAIAEKYAEVNGGHILNVNSKEEDDVVKNMLANTNGTINRAWLSLNDRTQEGVFEWDNKEPLKYTNWIDNEPNNSSGIEDYSIITTNGWNDVKADYCYTDNGFMVEYSTDINLSGINDKVDATMLLRHISGIELLTDNQYSRADINGDGNVNMADVIAILKNN